MKDRTLIALLMKEFDLYEIDAVSAIKRVRDHDEAQLIAELESDKDFADESEF